MGLNIRLYGINSPKAFTLSYKTGKTAGNESVIATGYTSYGSLYPASASRNYTTDPIIFPDASFDLVLFRIPLTSGNSGTIQNWDEGVGYDYYPTNKTSNTPIGVLTPSEEINDKAFSERPSNWFQTDNFTLWSESGMYSNTNTSLFVNFNDLQIVDIQHFDKGNEDINFDFNCEVRDSSEGLLFYMAILEPITTEIITNFKEIVKKEPITQ
jgi:hypothetical protein